MIPGPALQNQTFIDGFGHHFAINEPENIDVK